MPVPPAVIPEPDAGQPTAVAEYNTLIYSGPGENYAVYAAFLGGQKGLLTGKNAEGTWWAISVPPAPNEVGWVSVEWILISDAGNIPVLPTPPVPPTTELIPPEPEDPQATALVNTFVRTGPGASYPAYGIAEAGSSGRVLGVSEDGLWLVVRIDPEVVGAGHGWIELTTVEAVNTGSVPVLQAVSQSEIDTPPAPPAGSPQVTAPDYANVRSGPGFEFPIYFIAEPGGAAEVTGKSADGEWWQIKISTEYIGSGAAWVADAVVITENVENVPVVEAPPAPEVPDVPPTSGECVLIDQEPDDFAVIAPGTPFEMSWTVQNTGSEAWEQGVYELRYVSSSGIRLHEGSDFYDLRNTVEPQDNYQVSGSMIAPSEPGTYSETWSIASDDVIACPFWVTIVVE
jgi:uncharacterized protein YraI